MSEDYSRTAFPDGVTRLRAIMARLRDPDAGCPWDLEQTFATIAPCTIEEAYEVAEAVESGDWEHLREELGDLLLQVVFQAQIAQDQGLFEFEEVAQEISDKMVRRHPHIFGDAEKYKAENHGAFWQQIKAEEKKKRQDRLGLEDALPSALDGISSGLPPLMKAMKIQKKAVKAGFEWPDIQGVLDKVREELDEVSAEVTVERPNFERVEDEIGDLLFTVVNVARWSGVDPGAALRKCNAKFERRFKAMESSLDAEGQRLNDVTLGVMQSHWERVKKLEK